MRNDAPQTAIPSLQVPKLKAVLLDLNHIQFGCGSIFLKANFEQNQDVQRKLGRQRLVFDKNGSETVSLYEPSWVDYILEQVSRELDLLGSAFFADLNLSRICF